MPLNDYALVSLAEAKSYLKIDDASMDDQIILFINAATQIFETYTGRKLLEREHIEQYTANGGFVILNQYPVSVITNIWEDSSRIFGPDALLDPTDYYCDRNAGIVMMLDADFVSAPGAVKVQYTAGFAATPDDLRLACLMTIRGLVDRWVKGGESVSSLVFNNQTIGYVDRWVPEAVIVTLDRYLDRHMR